MFITGEDQAQRRAELARWRAGDKRCAGPATGALPNLKAGRTLQEVWNVKLNKPSWAGDDK